jgi:two-component system, response regulator PdtaR
MSLLRSLPGRAHRLLVVEDDGDASGLLVDALRRAGYEVTAAEGANDAIAAIATASPDLAVLDIEMPGPSGLTLSELLRDRFGIPFVFFSALDSEETVHRATVMGALDCLVKPLNVRECIPAINAAVARADELRRLRRSESRLSSALRHGRAISLATGLLVKRLRLSREMAREILRRQARTKRQRMSQVAVDLLRSVEHANSVGAASHRASDTADS